MAAIVFKKKFFSFGKFNSLLAFVVCLFSSFLLTNFSLASTFDTINKGFTDTGSQAGYGTQGNFAKVWTTYINGFVAIISTLFVVIIIYSGFLWLTARGREEQVTRAKTWMMQAVIGLAIIVGARILVELVFYYLGNAIGQK
jgi:cytochrome bd-type quinol oxidase subunit 2